MSARVQKIAAALLLVLGVQLWLIIGHGQYGSSPRPLWYVVIFLIAVIPWTARWFSRAVDWARSPTPRWRTAISIAIALLATIYLIGDGVYQHRDFIPKLHDEYMHLLQMQMLARGKLWMHQHAVADSFESFHIFVKPVYAGIYFPGTSLLMAPGVWLGLKFWVIPAIVCGCAVGLLYRIVTEMIDGFAGLLAALLLVSLTDFRYLALVAMSHGFMVFWGLALVWAWLHWRKSSTVAWAVMIGIAAGWGAITRPIDALCYAIPVGIAILLATRAWTWTQRGNQIAVMILAALPFLALQGILNWGVTGSVWETPDRLYNDLYTPGVSFGFHHFNPNAKPATDLPQRIKYYKEFTVPAAQEHQPAKVWDEWVRDRLPRLARFSLPSVLLLIVFPVGLLGIAVQSAGCAPGMIRDKIGPPLWALAGMLPLFVLAYMSFAYLLTHYAVVAAPAMIVWILAGVRAVENTWPRWKAHLATFSTLWIVMLGVHALPEFNRFVADDYYTFTTLRFNAKLESMITGRAIVLWHWNDWNNPHEEPVYNVSVAWPDDARIIRAQDRGPLLNEKLFDYYAKIQPDRKVYLIDRLDGSRQNYSASSLKYLGTVADLAHHPATRPTMNEQEKQP